MKGKQDFFLYDNRLSILIWEQNFVDANEFEFMAIGPFSESVSNFTVTMDACTLLIHDCVRDESKVESVPKSQSPWNLVCSVLEANPSKKSIVQLLSPLDSLPNLCVWFTTHFLY